VVAYLEYLVLGEEDEEYATLKVQTGTLPPVIQRRGNMSYLFKGQLIKGVYIQENRVDCFDGGQFNFTYLSHDAIALEMEKGWLGITKYGMFTDEIVFSSGKTISDLKLYNIHTEWESDLEIRFETKSEFIQI
jgi:hypothetical protein